MKDAKEYAESIGAIVVETSAKNAVNIEELFQGISKYMLSLINELWLFRSFLKIAVCFRSINYFPKDTNKSYEACGVAAIYADVN